MNPFRSALVITCLLSMPPAAQADSQVNTVAIVPTLHQFHESVSAYDYAALQRTIEALRPDILAVELTAKALAEQSPQSVKREYPEVVFPLLLRQRVQVIPLEPDEPRYSQLVGLIRGADAEFKAREPEKYKAFELYVEELYAYLFRRWTSECAVNSPETDALFAVKHAYQGALLGKQEQDGWEGWNQNFLEQIVRTVQSNRGKRIVVLVGVEHAYWLRDRLSQIAGVQLLQGCSGAPGAP